MSYEDDIRREEARRRLEERRRRSGTADVSRSTRSRDARSSRTRDSRSGRTRDTYSNRARTSRGSASSRATQRQRDPETNNRKSSSSTRTQQVPSRAGGVLSAIGSGISKLGAALWNAYLNLVERFQWKTIIATGILFILLIVLIVSGIRGCIASGGNNESSGTSASQSAAASSASDSAASASASSESSASSSSASTSSASSGSTAISNAKNPVDAIRLSVPEIDEAEIDETTLINILGDEYANQLIAQAESNNDAHWIASHPDEYLEDGTIVRYKMLRLAAKEPESIPFVRDWPTKYCADEPDYNEDHVDETSNGVPRLYQWDKRWGYTEYSSTTFALTGCAPTTMAMVYQARTGDTSKSPYDMGVYAMENGYATQFDGTDGSLFTYGAAGLGLTGMIIDNNSASLTSALANGQLVVVNVGPGDFTDSGHYFVATGLAPDGSVMINDPFSAVRSKQTWDADTICSQTKIMYAIA